MPPAAASASLLPEISVIVPAYNYGHLIHESLENLRGQTFSNWECIIVDDGSTDQTAAVCKSWTEKDQRFRYVYQRNAGLSAARNTGIKAARGRFIQLLDADDMLCSGKFAHQLQVFSEQPLAEIVYSEVRYFTSENHHARFLTLEGGYEPWMPGTASEDQLKLISDFLRMNLFAVNCPLMLKSVFNKVGLFDEQLRSVEDWDYWCRCALAGVNFYFDPVPEAMALVRTHPGSMSRNKPVMLEASRTVRYKLMQQIRRYPDRVARGELMKLNRQLTAYTVKLLSDHYRQSGKTIPFTRRLFEFAQLRGEYRHFFREMVQLFIKRSKLNLNS
jgi:glycosyltransferase involved in cell wall biosynthesis